MKGIRIFLAVMLSVYMMPVDVWADDISELKDMIQEMKASYETRINELEAKIDQLEARQKTQDKKMKTEMADSGVSGKAFDFDYVGRGNSDVGKGGFEVENPFGFGKVTLGGYVDHEFENFEDSDSTFDQHRWIINIGAQLHERLAFTSELEIEHGGPQSDDGGTGSAGDVKVEAAFIDFFMNDAINFRGGAILVPFGRYNLYHDSDMQDLTDRPIVQKDIIPTTWTEAGAGFFGEFNPTIGDYEDLVIGYETYVVNGIDDEFNDTGNSGGSLESDNNNNKAVVGRLTFSPAVGQEIGVSGYAGDYARGDSISGVGLDYFGTFGPFELVGEYARFDVDETPTASFDKPNFLQGAYAQVNYHFWPEFLDDSWLGRKFDNPTFTLVGRYGWAEIDDDGNDSSFGNNEEERWTIGFNYRPLESMVFKFEYQFNETENEAIRRGDKDGFMASVAMGF